MPTGQFPTILDVASRMGADGEPLLLAEMLSQANYILDDMPWIAGSEMAAHSFALRESIAAGAWVGYGMGSGYGKTTTGKARVSMATLEEWSGVDDNLARDSGDVDAFRESEDIGIMEGMSQTWASALMYGNTNSNPAQFFGLSSLYSSRATATANSARNVIDAKGRGTSNTSIWLIGWKIGTFYGAFPRGWKEGLSMEDLGDTWPTFDSAGNPYKAWTTFFRWRGCLVPQDWRNAVRIANIDTTAAGLTGPAPYDIFEGLIQAQYQLPAAGKNQSGIDTTDAPRDLSMGVRQVIYANRTGLHHMHRQSVRDRNVLLSSTDYAGKPCRAFIDTPIKCVDQILNTEAAI